MKAFINLFKAIPISKNGQKPDCVAAKSLFSAVLRLIFDKTLRLCHFNMCFRCMYFSENQTQ